MTHITWLLRIKDYYDVDNIGPETIKFVLMDDANAMLAAFKTGDLLLIDDIPTDEIAAYSEDPEFYKKGQLGTYYVSMNTELEPFDDPMVREALSLVIDRNYIVDTDRTSRTNPGYSICYRSVWLTLMQLKISVKLAEIIILQQQQIMMLTAIPLEHFLPMQDILDGAGFPVFTYLYNTSTGHQAIGEALQQMWKEELNIDCTLESQEWNTFLETRKDGNYSVARDGWLGDYNDPITFLDLFTSISGNNNAQWKNTDFDALIANIKVRNRQRNKI